jgi:endonuclease YncB( thermonuclease family)
VRLILAFLALLCAHAFAAGAQSISGTARIGDGDSWTINGIKMRAHAYDAPEWDQVCHRGELLRRYRCGLAATDALRSLVAGRPLDCDPVVQDETGRVTDRYGRTIVKCRVGDTDIGAYMVESGYAVAFLRYSNEYLPEQQRAQAAKRGLWSGVFMEPQYWRLSNRWWQ